MDGCGRHGELRKLTSSFTEQERPLRDFSSEDLLDRGTNGRKIRDTVPAPARKRKDASSDPRNAFSESIPIMIGPTVPPPIIPKPHTIEFASVTDPSGAMSPVSPRNKGKLVYEKRPKSPKLNSVSQKLLGVNARRSTDPTHPTQVTATMARRP